MLVRPATLEDAQILLLWRNDTLTRQMSKSTEAVSLDAHMRWFETSLQNPNRLLLTAEVDGTPIGTARMDSDGQQITASVTIAPGQRGRCIGGYGAIILRRACELAAERWGPLPFIAEIKRDNRASQLMAQRVGFTKGEPSTDDLIFFHKPAIMSA